MPFSVHLMRQLEEVDPPVRHALYAMLEEVERINRERITKTDFLELKQVVQELAEALKIFGERVDRLAAAQERTEERLDRLDATQHETQEILKRLAAAQEKTEKRLDRLASAQEKTEQRLERLAAAQEKTEQRIDRLASAQEKTEKRLDHLAAAQEKTEQRLERLAVAQERTEQRLERLAVAQERTEGQLQKLARSHQQLQKQVGGLSDAVGYGIEDRLMPHIPAFARREYGVEIEEVERRNVEYTAGKFDEVNILGRFRGPEGAGFLVGECKARPGKKDADRFAAMLKRLSAVLEGRLYPVLIGYTFPPEVERYVAEKHPDLKLVKTYQVQRAGE